MISGVCLQGLLGVVALDEPLSNALLPLSACGRVAQLVRAEVS